MIRVIGLEVMKIATKPRSYIGFLAIAIIISIIEFALYVDGKAYLEFITQSIEQTFYFEGNILNGYLVALIILSTLIIQIPLLIALVTGDLVSGEAASGTIRILLTKPISRMKILWAKFAAGGIYTGLILIWLGSLALGVGVILFGTGDLVALRSDGLVVLPADDVLWRFGAALSISYVSLMVVTSLSLMLSCFSDNSIGPIITTMAIIILFTIIGTMDVPVLDRIKPFLFTTHMIIWKNMFDNPLSVEVIRSSAIILLAHIGIFMGIATYRFTTKDILS